MSRGGHNRKTAAQARMDGTERRDRHVDPVEIAPGVFAAPPELSDDARVAWDRYIAPRLDKGFYEPAEAPLLALWCVALVRCFQADDLVPAGGVYETEDPYGNVTFKKHPAVTVFKDMGAELRALSSRLGLDPLARLALADGPKAGQGPELPADAPAAWVPTVVDGAG